MKTAVCYIVGAKPPGPVRFAPRPRLVIAADKGLDFLREQDIQPDLIVGDFDSLGRVPQGGNVILHPVEKDDTDTMLAIKLGLERGCRTFVLYGCLGGRLDHTYANLQALSYLADHGAAGWLLQDGAVVTLLRNGALDFPGSCQGTLSVFCPDGRASGVCLSGLYYPLDGYCLTSSFPLGVSNRFTGQPSRVSVDGGSLLLMWNEPPERVLDRL